MISWLAATLFALFFLITNIYISHKRLLWFDELNAIRTAKLPDVATLWRVQNSWGGDSAPISYAVLTRFIYRLTGGADISIRLLSAVAMTAAILVVFDCARRLRDGRCGLMAIGVLCGSFLSYYGFEGRPYMLMVLFAAIALWLWLHTKQDSTAAAVAFGVTVFLVITVQFYGILALVPFGLWDLWRKRWRQPSPKLLAGIAGMFGALGLCARQMQSGANWTVRSWCPPSAHALASVYTQIFPYGIFTLAAFVLLMCLTRSTAHAMSESERFCWLFLTIPIAGFIVAELVTNHFYNRYFVTLVPGVSVAWACFMSRHLTRRSSVLLILLLAAIPVGQQLMFAKRSESIDVPSATDQQSFTRKALIAESAILADGKKNIIADFLLAEEARHYSEHPELYVSFQADDVFHFYCKDSPSTCWTPVMVRHDARELAGLYPSDALLKEMNRSGFDITVKMTNPLVVYFSHR